MEKEEEAVEPVVVELLECVMNLNELISVGLDRVANIDTWHPPMAAATEVEEKQHP